MLFRWLDTTEVKQFAAAACADFVRLRKSTALRMDDPSRRSEKFAKLQDKINVFVSGLNFYKKARFLDELRSLLESAGVPGVEVAAFVNALTVSPISLRARR